jgi:hypothetical protein
LCLVIRAVLVDGVLRGEVGNEGFDEWVKGHRGEGGNVVGQSSSKFSCAFASC